MPDVDREGRIVRVRTLIGFAEPGNRPVHAGRLEVDLAHLRRVPVADLDRCVVGRHPAGSLRPTGRIRGSPRAGTKAQDDRGLLGDLVAGQGQLEAAGQHRVAGDCVTLERDQEELPAAPDGVESLAAQRLHLGGRAADGQGARSLGRPHRPTGQSGMERIGNHGQIGEFGHGFAIVVVRNPVLDSPGPERQDS